MTRKQVFIVALAGAIAGCAATQLAQVHYADAQYGPSDPRECAYLPVVRLDRDPARPTTAVPPGWRAVGGGERSVVLCR